MSELKQCPFCREQERLYIQVSIGDAYWVKCLECGAEGPLSKTEQEAIDAWNQRAERTCHMTCKKSGPLYDVWYFDCCEKEWAEQRCDSGIVDYPGLFCPWCGAKVVE